ncbi:helix-turn-helix domain-containing protein [Pseudomonas chlororaphis]|uniref:DNA-binding protein n=1 Tax=Pseudomonas chlororaphis O6 TaxID=1037915 RepID=A0AB33WST3_9PSED|nr:DNA-binding protein [Pseudomonas chlororaphis O6]
MTAQTIKGLVPAWMLPSAPHEKALPENKSFAESFVIARAQAGLTQRELAAKVGVSLSQICRYELGISRPRPRVLLALAEVFGKTTSPHAPPQEARTATIVTGPWPSYAQFKDLPERERWVLYGSAKAYRESLETQRFAMAESYDDFISRVCRELEL